MKNLTLWNNVCITDPTYTKKFNQGFSGTAINSTYLVKLATEHWGMIGLGWGYKILEERIDTGATVYNEEGNVIGNIKTHTIKLELWVKQGDERAVVEHFGHTPYIYYSQKNEYWVTDQEAPKKSLTDAIKKCLSMFGFAADIYLGMFDDYNYVEEVKAKAAIDKADNKEEEILRQKQEYMDLLEANLKLIKSSVSNNELEIIYKSISRKAKRQDDKKGLKLIMDATNQRKTELEKKESK